MRARNTVHGVLVSLELSQKRHCKAPLTKVTMDDQLRDPADDLVVVFPTTSKRVADKKAVNSDPDVGAIGARWKTLRTKAVRAHLYSGSYGW